MKINVITLFPEAMKPYLEASILGRASREGKVEVNLIQLRDYSLSKHKQVDDSPFGGGSGMVMMCEPLANALKDNSSDKTIYLSPKGKTFNQQMAHDYSSLESITLVCGHYEGIDQRIIDKYIDEEVSIGDYILTGGELGALVIIDAVARLVDGVIKKESIEDESFSNFLLEYPHYTKPREFEGLYVPDVLVGGNHKLIDEYRFEESVKITLLRRPELLEEGIRRCAFDKKQLKMIEKIKKLLK